MAPTQSARRHSRAQRKSSNYHGEVSRPFNKSKSAVAAIDKVETYADNMCGNTRKCFSGCKCRGIPMIRMFDISSSSPEPYNIR